MLLVYQWNAIWQSLKDTWIPRFIPFIILISIFIGIALIRKNKD